MSATDAAGASPPPGRAGPAPRASRAARVLAPYVPSVLGLHAGGLAWSALGMPGLVGGAAALVVLVVVFTAALAAQRALWRRPAARAALKVLFAAHVVAWSAWGWASTQPREAGPVETGAATVWQGPPRRFLAGVGGASFRLTERDSVAGYGARPRRVAMPWPAPGPALDASLALMRRGGVAPAVPMFRRGETGFETLGAKAIVLRPAEGTGATVAICRLDLVMCEPRLRDAVLERASGLGLVPDTLWLCATHTHSGPGGFAHATLAQAIATDHWSPEVFGRVADAAARAIRRAYESAVPARIGFVRARDVGPDGRPVLAKNRAQDETPDRVDPEVLGIRLDAASGGRRIALLFDYAVHPTRNRPSDVRFSADVAGAIERSAAIGAGAEVVFVNGAEGDVKSRGDAVRPEGPDGLLVVPTFEAVVAAALEKPATDDTLRVAAASSRRDLGSPRYVHALAGSRGAFLDVGERPFGSFASGVGTLLCLPLDALVWSAGIPRVRIGGSPAGSVGAYAGLTPYVDTTSFPFGALRLETGSTTAALLAVPGEPTTAVGERLKEEMRLRGASPAFVVGLANDHFAYCATAEECAEGTYEGRFTLYGPSQTDRVVEACGAALEAAGFRRDVPR